MQQGCRLLLVASRSGRLSEEMFVELAAAGCTVLSIKLDCSIALALAEVLEWAHNELPHIDHFAHAAGVPGFALLEDMTISKFRAVVDVKVCCSRLH